MQYQWARLIHHTSGLPVRQRRGSGFARGVPSPARALAGCTAKRQIVAEAERISQADPLREGDCWRGSNDALQGVLQVMAGALRQPPGLPARAGAEDCPKFD